MSSVVAQYKAKALYQFASSGDGEISLQVGQIIDVLDASDEDWTLVRNKEGNVGYCPANYIQKVENLPPPLPKSRPRNTSVSKESSPVPTNEKTTIVVSSTTTTTTAPSTGIVGKTRRLSETSTSPPAVTSSATTPATTSSTPTVPVTASTNSSENKTGTFGRSKGAEVGASPSNIKIRAPLPFNNTATDTSSESSNTSSKSSTVETKSTPSSESAHNLKAKWEQQLKSKDEEERNKAKPNNNAAVAELRKSVNIKSLSALLEGQPLKLYPSPPSTSAEKSPMKSTPSSSHSPPLPGMKPQQEIVQLQDETTMQKTPSFKKGKDAGNVESSTAITPRGHTSTEKSTAAQDGEIEDTRSRQKSSLISKLSNKVAKVFANAPPQDEDYTSPTSASSNTSFDSNPSSTSGVNDKNAAIVRIALQKKLGPNFSIQQTEKAKLVLKKLLVILRWKRLREFVKNDASLKDNRIRRALIHEIYSTEVSYFKSLETAVDVFYKPLQDKKYVSKQELESLFGSIEQVKQVNFEILSQLEAQMRNSDCPRIGLVFKSMAPFLKIYCDYVNNYDESCNMYDKLKAKNKKFSHFCDKQLVNPQCAGLDLPAFLIQPIQRVPRYRLLLTDVLKKTPEDHVDYDMLKQGLDAVVEIAKFINERKRQTENTKHLTELNQRFKELATEIIQPHRKYIYTLETHAFFYAEKLKDQHLVLEALSEPYLGFLFNDLLLFVTKEDKSERGIEESYPIYLAFAKLENRQPLSFVVSFILRNEKWRAVCSFERQEQCDIVYKQLDEYIQNTRKNALTKLGTTDLETLNSIPDKRLTVATIGPKTKNEYTDIKDKREKSEQNKNRLIKDIESNEKKIQELLQAIEDMKKKLQSVSAEMVTYSESETVLAKQVEGLDQTHRECDSKLMLILNKDYGAFKFLFNDKPKELEQQPQQFDGQTNYTATTIQQQE